MSIFKSKAKREAESKAYHEEVKAKLNAAKFNKPTQGNAYDITEAAQIEQQGFEHEIRRHYTKRGHKRHERKTS